MDLSREDILNELSVLYQLISKFRLGDEFKKDVEDIQNQINELQEMLTDLERKKDEH